MTRNQFEDIAEEAFHNLPEKFREAIDNVEIVVEDVPTGDDLQHQGKGGTLLGLYKGIPLPKRGTWYGTTPTLPDRIILYQKNIEGISGGEKEIRHQIYITLYHEIGHYFGMTEAEIRRSMEDDIYK
ncbi:MAG: metallopeptidase family protein [Bacteroidota bacterium]